MLRVIARIKSITLSRKHTKRLRDRYHTFLREIKEIRHHQQLVITTEKAGNTQHTWGLPQELGIHMTITGQDHQITLYTSQTTVLAHTTRLQAVCHKIAYLPQMARVEGCLWLHSLVARVLRQCGNVSRLSICVTISSLPCVSSQTKRT